MSTSLQTLKGFRDFLPHEKRQRDWVQNKIVEAFFRYGFSPLETPTLEYRETIMGKYGQEADKLVYSFTDNGGREVALRYDQTVPTARVIAQYQHELPMPFRRFQVQNVFRADKPQKGRYREFMQCDIDIFGSTDALADAEVLATIYTAYKNLGLDTIELRVNDRQLLLETLQPFVTETISVFSIIQTVDKLDKIAETGVVAELENKGLSSQQAHAVMSALNSVKMNTSLQGIVELAIQLGVPETAVVFTPTLARGLDYYTGMIVEVVAPEWGNSSLGGGGRYDNLIESLSGISVPAVGFAIGFDRTVEICHSLEKIPDSVGNTQVFVTVFDENSRKISAQVAAHLREAGIVTELSVMTDKLGKQFKRADAAAIPFAVVIGPDEQAAGVVQLKDLRSGEQRALSISECITHIIQSQ